MDHNLISFINSHYELTEVKNSEFEHIEFNGMVFTNKHYIAKGLGSVSTMEMVAAGGAMKMDSIIINPFYVDSPLVSYDRVKAFGKDTLLLESYNTCLDNVFNQESLLELKEKYAYIPDHVAKPCWYDDITMPFAICKDGSTSDEIKYDEIAKEFIEAYILECLKTPLCDVEKKKQSAKLYSDGLLNNGGPATDPFKMAVGVEKTTEFFNKFLFAVEE